VSARAPGRRSDRHEDTAVVVDRARMGQVRSPWIAPTAGVRPAITVPTGTSQSYFTRGASYVPLRSRRASLSTPTITNVPSLGCARVKDDPTRVSWMFPSALPALPASTASHALLVWTNLGHHVSVNEGDTMSAITERPPLATRPPLAISKKEAAEQLGLSVDGFERHVQPHIHTVRVGRRILVPVDRLEAFLRDE
jgi:hypothetical protein